MKTKRANAIAKAWMIVRARHGHPDEWPGMRIEVPLMAAGPVEVFTGPPTVPPEFQKLIFRLDGFRLDTVQYRIVHCDGLIVWQEPILDDA